jgi:SP family sugar:H+ symporter-like MFS transporter
MTAIGLMAFTEQIGRKWSLLIGSIGQAFAMFYIGVNQAVHPPTGELDGNSTFAIVCVYLFVVFYSFGWGPTPFILSSECSPNHVRSLLMAAALMTQWLFNFVIAKITPLMLANITYGTFLLFGSLCIAMGIVSVIPCCDKLCSADNNSGRFFACRRPRVSDSSRLVSYSRGILSKIASRIPGQARRARSS